MISGSIYALLAGFWGAGASLSAKLFLSAYFRKEMCVAWLSDWTEVHDGVTVCEWLHIPLWLLGGGLLFSCNAFMWTFFSKALRHCSFSARATLTTTTGNFISSAVLGRMIFGETQTIMWWAGIFFTLCGLLVLHGTTPQAIPLEEGKKDQ
ncbi:transmembrane protein 42-like [Aulostomus maculatus]